ncbi:hypothetical protein AND_000121 [Anopheles darlingi]|uniref:Ras-associating domain-containing protein n=1 Tax=Anopheles darlingi TaxID=43151 RepID=W5JUL3_ANODA|nr:hypothetical protein AND_000121 [Anopheles darlingi]
MATIRPAFAFANLTKRLEPEGRSNGANEIPWIAGLLVVGIQRREALGSSIGILSKVVSGKAASGRAELGIIINAGSSARERSSKMLKHVQISPMRSRADSLSMRSSTSCASSLCGSPEPPSDQLRSHSRASSYSSLNETIPQIDGSWLFVWHIIRGKRSTRTLCGRGPLAGSIFVQQPRSASRNIHRAPPVWRRKAGKLNGKTVTSSKSGQQEKENKLQNDMLVTPYKCVTERIFCLVRIEWFVRVPAPVSRASTAFTARAKETTIKIYTACLRQDIEYKTLGISYDATSKGVVQQVLRRCKMRHRDPRLFYLTMEVTVRRPGVKSVLELDDEARPALLQACHPKGDSRFCLQQKPGGLIRVHTSALQPNSQYKSLLISEETTSDELLSLLLSCYNSMEPVEQFSLYEVCPGQEYQRKLHPDDLPLKTQLQRQQKGEIMHFLVRRNPNYPRRRQLLATIAESKHFIRNTQAAIDSSNTAMVSGQSQLQTAAHPLHHQQSHHPHHHHHHHRLSLHSTTTGTGFTLGTLCGPVTSPTNSFISDIVDGLSSLNDLPCETNTSSSFFRPSSLDDSTASTDSTDSTESSSSSCSSFSSLSSDSSSSSSSTASSSAAELTFAEDEHEVDTDTDTDTSTLRRQSDIATLKRQHQQQQQQQQNNNEEAAPCQQCPTKPLPPPAIAWRHSEPAPELTAPPEIKSKNSAQHQQPPPRPAKSSTMLAALSKPSLPASPLAAPSYNPVYNIREIRTVSQSFSALGIDKKLVDIRSPVSAGTTAAGAGAGASAGAGAAATAPTVRSSVVKEMVNTDPAKGVGNFVYI